MPWNFEVNTVNFTSNYGWKEISNLVETPEDDEETYDDDQGLTIVSSLKLLVTLFYDIYIYIYHLIIFFANFF